MSVPGQLVAPNGSRITKSLESVLVLYDLDGFFRSEEGQIEYDYDTTIGSEVLWDTAQPEITDKGVPKVQAEDGTVWPLSDCTFEPDEGEEVADG